MDIFKLWLSHCIKQLNNQVKTQEETSMMKTKKIYREDEPLEYDNIYNVERDELYVENLTPIWYNWFFTWTPHVKTEHTN